MPSGKATPAARRKCKRCRCFPGPPGFDQGLCPACQIADLRHQLQQAERLARIHLVQAWQREDITRAELREAQDIIWRLEAERDVAIKRGAEAWCWGQAGWNTARKWLVWHDDEQRLKGAAIRQAEAAEALLLRINKVCKHTLEGDRTWYKMVISDIGQLTVPAEAQEGGD